MFSAIQPIPFVVKASIQGGALCFDTTATVLPFRRIEDHPPTEPSLIGPDAGDVWTLEELPSSGNLRLFLLTLSGQQLNERVHCQPDDPLYRAILDRTTYDLSVKLGPFPLLPQDDPCEEGAILTATLKLKMDLRVS